MMAMYMEMMALKVVAAIEATVEASVERRNAARMAKGTAVLAAVERAVMAGVAKGTTAVTAEGAVVAAARGEAAGSAVAAGAAIQEPVVEMETMEVAKDGQQTEAKELALAAEEAEKAAQRVKAMHSQK